MADCMMFPKDWHDFIKDYSFIDSEHVYTNGSELIQVLRVTQLIEHLLKEQEAVKPKKADNPEESEYCCGICGYPLWMDKLYCAHCGRPVLWEGEI